MRKRRRPAQTEHGVGVSVRAAVDPNRRGRTDDVEHDSLDCLVVRTHSSQIRKLVLLDAGGRKIDGGDRVCLGSSSDGLDPFCCERGGEDDVGLVDGVDLEVRRPEQLHVLFQVLVLSPEMKRVSVCSQASRAEGRGD